MSKFLPKYICPLKMYNLMYNLSLHDISPSNSCNTILFQLYFKTSVGRMARITQKSVHSVSTGTINVPDPYGWRRADLKVSLYTFKTICNKTYKS